MIWRKYEERLIGKNLIVLITNVKNKEDNFISKRISLYKSKGYTVKVKYFEVK